jgi:hypothetical protein
MRYFALRWRSTGSEPYLNAARVYRSICQHETEHVKRLPRVKRVNAIMSEDLKNFIRLRSEDVLAELPKPN